MILLSNLWIPKLLIPQNMTTECLKMISILISNKDFPQRATDLQGVKYLKMEEWKIKESSYILPGAPVAFPLKKLIKRIILREWMEMNIQICTTGIIICHTLKFAVHNSGNGSVNMTCKNPH